MRIAVLGLGKVGVSLAEHFIASGNEVIGIDDKQELRHLSEAAQQLKIKFYLAGAAPLLSEIDEFYISPGVSHDHPFAAQARAQGVKLQGELDLGAALTKVPIIAITGTNGKSTTTMLIGHILEQAKLKVRMGGNLGTPFLDLVKNSSGVDWLVVEVSSFQLELAQKFKPRISVLLNITDDHYDRHAGIDAYMQAKAKVFSNQTAEDYLIYNADDLQVLKAVHGAKATLVPFSSIRKVEGAYEDKGKLTFSYRGKQAAWDLSKVQLKGVHNLENMLAAVAATSLAGIEPACIQRALESFRGLPHRLEFVRKVGGVEFYDDSKGTNVGAVVMSLASFEQDVVLIAGGRDKGGDYSPLKALVKNKCRGVVVLGEAAPLIASALEGCTQIERVKNMEEAVQKANQLAKGCGYVLLSPACSSFDMYRDYHERGNDFRRCVDRL